MRKSPTKISKANCDLFALKTLRNHGLDKTGISQVCRSTLINRLVYASPAWRGFCNAVDISRLVGVERKARRWGFYEQASQGLVDILDQADKELFHKILSRPDHVLQQHLPPVKVTGHNLRERGHSYILPRKTNFSSNNFIIRMLYNTI